MSDYFLHVSLSGMGVCLCKSNHAEDKLSDTKSLPWLSDEFNSERKSKKKTKVEVWVQLGDEV